MKYQEARQRVCDGDIIFIRKHNSSIISKLVQFATRSKFSHVGIAFWIEIAGTKRLMMAEAQGSASRRIVNMSFYDVDEFLVISSPKSWHEYAPTALRSLGQVPYGWFDAIYVGFREFLLKYFNVRIPTTNFKGEICSEYVAIQLQLPETRISPQMLYEQLIVLGHNIKEGEK